MVPWKTLKLLIYFWLCWVFAAVLGLSLVVVSGGSSLTAVRGLLIRVSSPVASVVLALGTQA